MQKKTLLTLIQVVLNIILCFVATFGYCLAITCRFVHKIVTWLYLACSKKHVQQESVVQPEKHVQPETHVQPESEYTSQLRDDSADQWEYYTNNWQSSVDLNQTCKRGAIRIIAAVAFEQAVKEVKSARAENNAVKRSCSDKIAANPRAYAQGTWEATRTTWTGTKTKTA